MRKCIVSQTKREEEEPYRGQMDWKELRDIHGKCTSALREAKELVPDLDLTFSIDAHL